MSKVSYIIPLANVILRLQSSKDSAQESLDKWAAEFAKKPQYALEWIGSTFVHAKRLEVAERLLHLIQFGQGRGLSQDEILETLKDEVKVNLIWRASQNSSQGSSVGKNHMDAAEVTVLAEMANLLQ